MQPGSTDAERWRIETGCAALIDAALGRWPTIEVRRDRTRTEREFGALVAGEVTVQQVRVLRRVMPRCAELVGHPFLIGIRVAGVATRHVAHPYVGMIGGV